MKKPDPWKVLAGMRETWPDDKLFLCDILTQHGCEAERVLAALDETNALLGLGTRRAYQIVDQRTGKRAYQINVHAGNPLAPEAGRPFMFTDGVGAIRVDGIYTHERLLELLPTMNREHYLPEVPRPALLEVLLVPQRIIKPSDRWTEAA